MTLIRHGATSLRPLDRCSGATTTAAHRRRQRSTMGGLLWLAATFALPQAANARGLAQAMMLAILIAGGIAIYGLFLAGFGVIRWHEAANLSAKQGQRLARLKLPWQWTAQSAYWQRASRLPA